MPEITIVSVKLSDVQVNMVDADSGRKLRRFVVKLSTGVSIQVIDLDESTAQENLLASTADRRFFREIP